MIVKVWLPPGIDYQLCHWDSDGPDVFSHHSLTLFSSTVVSYGQEGGAVWSWFQFIGDSVKLNCLEKIYTVFLMSRLVWALLCGLWRIVHKICQV